jgi:prepilin peptidase CpaA
MNVWLSAILLVVACWATYTDLKQRRIANWLTFGSAGLALALRLALGGPQAFLNGIEGWLVGTGVLLIPFALGWMGAGDVKLLAAFGAMGGVEFALQSGFLGCLFGGLLAVFYLLREHKLWFVLKHLVIYIRHPLGSVLEAKRRMPFGPALAVGAAVGLVVTRALV